MLLSEVRGVEPGSVINNAGSGRPQDESGGRKEVASPHGIGSRVWMSNVPLDVNDGASGGREFTCDYSVLA
jgi:hypothetical protein